MSPKTTKKILYILIALTLLTPLILVKSPSQFYAGKAIFLQISVILVSLFYFLLVRSDRTYLPRSNTLTVLVLVYLGIYAVSAFLSPTLYRSIWGNYDRGSLGLANLSFFAVLFLIASSALKSDIHWHNLFKFSLFISVIAAVFALTFVRVSIVGTRLFGTLGNPALLAGYLLPHTFFALWFLTQTRKKKIRALYFGIFVFLSIAIFLTAVRGALLGLFVGLFFFLIFWGLQEKSRRKYLLFALITLVILPATLFAFKDADFVRSNFYLSKITDTNLELGASIGNRLAVWKIALEGFKERPFFGWGPENFVLVYYNHFNPKMFINSFKENVFDHAHSVILEVLSTVGIFGLIAYLGIWVFIFYKLKQKNNLILAPLFVAIFIHNLFIFDSLSSYLIFFLLLGFLAASEAKSPEVKRNSSVFPYFFLLVFILLVALSISFIKAAGREFLAKQSASFVLSNAELLEAADDAFKEDLVSEISRIESFMERDSQNLIWYVYYGALNNEAGRLIDKNYYSQSANALENKVPDFPPHQQFYYQLSKSQAGEGNFSEAVKTADFTISLNPKSNESLWQKALLYINFGDFETGYKLIQEAEERGYPWFLSFNDTMKLIDIEIKRENYGRVTHLYEKYAIGRFRPDNAQLYASLAATYARLGDKEKAIRYAKRAAELDPAFADDAEIFIETLNQ